MSEPKKPKWRWFQFSLRIFLLVITLTAIFLGTWANRLHRRARVLAEIRAMGGYVHTVPDGPAWLRSWLGEDYFVNVREVGLDHALATDVNLRLISELADIQTLHVGGQLTFEQGGALSGMSYTFKRKSLDDPMMYPVNPSSVTDSGLRHLRALTTLENLYLTCCPRVSEEGLEFLYSCTSLQTLDLAGIAITDDGLLQLKHLPALRRVTLAQTKATSDGVAQLQKDRPQLRIDYE